MYLTAKKERKARGVHDHEELELLLESFSKQVEEIVSEVEAITVGLFFSGGPGDQS
jgi:magnesium transporter